jgi:hypothetical protein
MELNNEREVISAEVNSASMESEKNNLSFEEESSDISEPITKPDPFKYRNSFIYSLLGVITIILSGIIIYFLYKRDEDYRTSIYARDVLHNYWMIGTIIAYYDQDRRDIIRNSWQRLYGRYNATFRFVIGRPSEEYMPIIRLENSTYGDIICICHLEENFHNAATMRPVEFFRHLKEHSQPYTYVSRIDGDAFLNVAAFWDKYLKPNLADPRRIIIARDTYPMNFPFPVPGGQFYTLSWDLLNINIRLYDKNPIDYENDDMIFGQLMYEAQEEYKLIDLFCYVAFDYNPNVTDVNRWEHMVTESSINPHKMKTRESYLEVASMFDEKGVNIAALNEVNARYNHNNSQGWQLSCSQNISYRIYPISDKRS